MKGIAFRSVGLECGRTLGGDVDLDGVEEGGGVHLVARLVEGRGRDGGQAVDARGDVAQALK